MIRNIKALGLAVVAVLAMAAVVASAAQATTTFTAGASSGKLKATQTAPEVFSTDAGVIQCPTATKEGSYNFTAFTNAKFSAAYSGCNAFGFLNASVTMNGCEYEVVGQASGTLANMSILCPAGKDITVSNIVCVVHIEPQTGIAHVLFSNGGGSPDDVNMTFTLTGIKYTATSGCPGEGTGKTTSNGTMTGSATLKAFNSSGTQVNLTVDD